MESVHPHIIQARPKHPDSWWPAANAKYMLASRANRANGK
jgi:hypothetical protein